MKTSLAEIHKNVLNNKDLKANITLFTFINKHMKNKTYAERLQINKIRNLINNRKNKTVLKDR